NLHNLTSTLKSSAFGCLQALSNGRQRCASMLKYPRNGGITRKKPGPIRRSTAVMIPAMSRQQTNRRANSTSNKVERPLPGARESKAGDYFHVLWAIRRALQLLDPKSGLCRVVMEGLTPLDTSRSEEDFLGVDLTEYYGGDDFSTAATVITSQLKYSTR